MKHKRKSIFIVLSTLPTSRTDEEPQGQGAWRVLIDTDTAGLRCTRESLVLGSNHFLFLLFFCILQRPLSYQGEEINKSFPSSEIQQLKEQNTSLRNVIAQMRKEMEALSDQILPSARLGGETSQTNQPDPKAAADSAVPGEQGKEGRWGVFSTGSVNRLHLES